MEVPAIRRVCLPGKLERQRGLSAARFALEQRFVLLLHKRCVKHLKETCLKSEYTQPEWTVAFAQDSTGKKRKLIPRARGRMRAQELL